MRDAIKVPRRFSLYSPPCSMKHPLLSRTNALG